MNKQPFGDSCGSAMKAVMITGRNCAVLLVGLLVSGTALAQQSCIRGMHIDGVITDPTGAVIPGAHVQAGTGATGVTDATGHYAFACVPLTSTTITANADGFAQATARAHARAGGAAHVNLQLAVASVETDVQVNANANGADDGRTAGTTVLGTEKCNGFRMIRTNFFASCRLLLRVEAGLPGTLSSLSMDFRTAARCLRRVPSLPFA